MALKALSILSRKENKNGFVLVVEGGRIDHAHHANYANRAMEETVSMADAVEKSVEELETRDMLDDTLIIITSDHSHTMTMMGYGKRGTDIRGSSISYFGWILAMLLLGNNIQNGVYQIILDVFH